MSKQVLTLQTKDPQDATQTTREANSRAFSTLPFSNREDFQNASRGLIATLPEAMIKGADGHLVWDLTAYSFLPDRDAPPTVHPSLWRQAQLNMINGLFKVADHIYQIRGFDLSNMTINEWYNRGYYGSVNHNSKGIFQLYLGFYSSHPSDLHPLPPEEAAKHYVAFMGGAKAILEKARASYEQGEYRWVAEVMKHVVFAHPEDEEAKHLLADVMEQLGYQAENATWRNEYLMGARELRQGNLDPSPSADRPDVIRAMTVPMYFDYLGIRLNGPKTEGKQFTLNWNFTDVNEQYALRLENCTLTYTPNKQLPTADATLTLTRETLDKINIGAMTFEQAVSDGTFRIEGKHQVVSELFGLLDTFQQLFAIVTP